MARGSEPFGRGLCPPSCIGKVVATMFGRRRATPVMPPTKCVLRAGIAGCSKELRLVVGCRRQRTTTDGVVVKRCGLWQ
ncbi:hypothetical protein BHE74_00035772 [Ensete ventricosum]|nr:hypothetical protein GW17_00030280 [Ensete ventricosum]RWW57446.1 hypothetical protein BHE74_00035772 [Ensete ventricosum]RZS10335.1 hypothetical protein BHM03_00041549 [Ensete ventricosum]